MEFVIITHRKRSKINIVVTSYPFGIFKNLDYESLFEGVNEWIKSYRSHLGNKEKGKEITSMWIKVVS
jgi:hypothetical protein